MRSFDYSSDDSCKALMTRVGGGWGGGWGGGTKLLVMHHTSFIRGHISHIIDQKPYIIYHVSCIMYHVSCIICHVAYVIAICHITCILYLISYILYLLSHIICEELLDLALLLSVVVRTRAELLRLLVVFQFMPSLYCNPPHSLLINIHPDIYIHTCMDIYI